MFILLSVPVLPEEYTSTDVYLKLNDTFYFEEKSHYITPISISYLQQTTLQKGTYNQVINSSYASNILAIIDFDGQLIYDINDTIVTNLTNSTHITLISFDDDLLHLKMTEKKDKNIWFKSIILTILITSFIFLIMY